MTAPIHTRPFDMSAAKAGAPYCCRDGSEATVLKWDCRDKDYPLVGVIGTTDTAADWGFDGRHCMASISLVMTPLGYIDGKPVFAGDEIMDCECLTKVSATPGDHDFKYCSWPAPEKVYPETLAHWDEFMDSIDATGPRGGLTINERQVTAIANAALRHACESGQVITKEDHEAALHRLGESLRIVADTARAERDMAVAQAVESEMRAAGEQMAARRAARDMAIAEAVRGEAYVKAMNCQYGYEGIVIRQIDLATIIAEVKP